MKHKFIPTFLLLFVTTFILSAGDPLPSWNNEKSKNTIIQFVDQVTNKNSKHYVEPKDRIAVFDNDGTLWAEKPVYFQLFFAMDRVKEMASDKPEWKTQEPFASILKGDPKAALKGGEKAILDLIMATHSGMSSDEYTEVVRQWVKTAKHPQTQKKYIDMIYQPMFELLVYLRDNKFQTFIMSGGGIEFMRVWAEVAYGIPPQQVVGSRITMEYEFKDGKPVLIRKPKLAFLNDEGGKVVSIQNFIGKRPIFSAGNSDGDIAMSQWTTSKEGPSLAMFVHHTDAEREWAYDRNSHIGQLDKGLDVGKEKGWLFVDIKTDWRIIYPEK
ncbi:MAG: haloacid dehalogenase-like hydrolase [Lentisphaeria bacterium]|nr:haloacid dehalogenase-like hydrolase [Lentisphaeria bacterium]